ncbi:MAG TPA: FMN-binding negative transcriptional regulator [Acidobacteriaceae bacterium]|jgi:transcriptional regulator
MYIPEVFREEDRNEIGAMIRACGLATLVTNSSQGLIATPVPMFLVEDEAEYGVLYGHIAKANPQWKDCGPEDALAIFQGANAYISPSWYPSKAENGRVVPTWNYLAVHVYGPLEFYQEPERLLQMVTQLTSLHEAGRPESWAVTDAPPEFVQAQLRGIVGFRIPIRRIDAKKKLSQNQTAPNRAGAKAGLLESASEGDRAIGAMIEP